MYQFTFIDKGNEIDISVFAPTIDEAVEQIASIGTDINLENAALSVTELLTDG